MKGQSELTATFVKLVQIGLVIVGALAIYFTYIQYQIFVYFNALERESYVLGDALLSSNCLTEEKGIFIQSKLDSFDINCLNYPKGKFKISSSSYLKEIEFQHQESYNINTTFDAVIKLNTGQIEPAKLEVFL